VVITKKVLRTNVVNINKVRPKNALRTNVVKTNVVRIKNVLRTNLIQTNAVKTNVVRTIGVLRTNDIRTNVVSANRMTKLFSAYLTDLKKSIALVIVSSARLLLNERNATTRANPINDSTSNS